MKVELTDKEVSAIHASINFMVKYIEDTATEPDNLTSLKEEMMVEFINILEKLELSNISLEEIEDNNSHNMKIIRGVLTNKTNRIYELLDELRDQASDYEGVMVGNDYVDMISNINLITKLID
jgi:hypothetical protein